MGTFIVLGAVVSAVSGALYVIRSDRKKGRNSCGCSCKGCPNKDFCHKSDNQ